MEVALTERGLPVRILISAHESGFTYTASLDILAVNFPLVIEAPPAAQTISVAQLKELGKRVNKGNKRKG
jgi:hypothetical protein